MPPDPPRFLVDEMLGNVARDLRLLGYDATSGTGHTDPELLHLAQSQGRTLLTRDRNLARRARGVACLLVGEPVPRRQIVEVLRAFGLGASPGGPFSRCLACNGSLRGLPADEAAVGVPDHVAITAIDFRECPQCGRIYWPGTHLNRLRQRIRELLGSLHPPRARV